MSRVAFQQQHVKSGMSRVTCQDQMYSIMQVDMLSKYERKYARRYMNKYSSKYAGLQVYKYASKSNLSLGLLVCKYTFMQAHQHASVQSYMSLSIQARMYAIIHVC